MLSEEGLIQFSIILHSPIFTVDVCAFFTVFCGAIVKHKY